MTTSVLAVGSTVFITATVTYVTYYLFMMSRRPRIYGKSCHFMSHLMKACPMLSEKYVPPLWAVSGHVTTVARSMIQTKPPISYDREIVRFEDGGELGLDWVRSRDSLSPAVPVMLVLPGLTSTSDDVSIQLLADDGQSQGYRTVVMNYRGMAGVTLKTRRAYSAANTEDLQSVITHIHTRYPAAAIVAVGLSLGGCILTKHLVLSKVASGLSAVLTICSPWDLSLSSKNLEKPLNWFVYNRYLLNATKQLAVRNSELYDKDELVEVLQCKTLKEFDNKVIVPIFGYDSVSHYYRDASSKGQLHNVAIPLVSITAMDDPFVPIESLPYSEFQENSNMLLVVTQHGGHFGYLEGLYPRNKTWINRFTRQFLGALKNYEKI